MLIEIILALIIGVIAGTITGLSPGIHINLVAAFLISSISLFDFIPLIALIVFIVSMSITHTFLDFIPSIYLGAPEEDSFLSVMPGHRLLQEGRGHEAFVITLYGSLAALLIILLLTPLFILLLPPIFTIIKFAIPLILIFISLYIIFREKNFARALIIFILAGFLGYITFNLPVREPLLPLLSGMFGLSSLLTSLKSNSKPSKQKTPPLKKIKLTKSEFFKSLSAIIISSPLCSFLPGIGSGHAATIGSEIIPQSTKGFLFLVGATNTIVMGLSFITLYAIDKTRSGSAAAIQQLLPNLSSSNLIVIIITILLSGILASVLGVALSKIAANQLNKINYKHLTLATMAILLAVNLFFSNFIGIIVLLTSTALGIFCISSNSRRINLMGALIIPAIIYYLIN